MKTSNKITITKTWETVWGHHQYSKPESGGVPLAVRKPVKPRRRLTLKTRTVKPALKPEHFADALGHKIANATSAYSSDDIADGNTSIWGDTPRGMLMPREKYGKKQLRIRQGMAAIVSKYVETVKAPISFIDSLVIEDNITTKEISQLGAHLKPSRLTFTGVGSAALQEFSESAFGAAQGVKDLGFNISGETTMTGEELRELYPNVERVRISSDTFADLACSVVSDRRLTHLAYHQPNMKLEQLNRIAAQAGKDGKRLGHLQLSQLVLPETEEFLNLSATDSVERLYLCVSPLSIRQEAHQNNFYIRIPALKDPLALWHAGIVLDARGNIKLQVSHKNSVAVVYKNTWNSRKNMKVFCMTIAAPNAAQKFGNQHGKPSGYYTLSSLKKHFRYYSL